MTAPLLDSSLPVQLSVVVSWTGLGVSESSPVFLVNGSLLMAPLFPRSGPGESGSPTSAVILRCYDFPTRIPGHLFVSLPGSTLSFSVRVSQLPLALPEGRRGAFRARSIVQPTTPSVGLLSRGRGAGLFGFP